MESWTTFEHFVKVTDTSWEVPCTTAIWLFSFFVCLVGRWVWLPACLFVCLVGWLFAFLVVPLVCLVGCRFGFLSACLLVCLLVCGLFGLFVGLSAWLFD